MERLIEYLTTGRPVAFVGAGVSREIGLPGWHELMRRLLDDLPKAASARRAEAQRLLDARRYPAVAEWIADNAGDAFLLERCKLLLRDRGRAGVVASFIARFGFAAVFTTNFDAVIARHFEEAKQRWPEFGNSERDLSQVELDVLPCIVHVHGWLHEPESLILKESQYASARSAGRFEYLRAFLAGHLQTRRFLILGYSFSDPDIEFILERVAQNLRRATPIFAVVADAPPEEVVRLRRLYNVEVVTYSNQSGAHRELASMIESLSPFVQDAGPRAMSLDDDLHRAQLLYLWNRFNLAPDVQGARVDALKSIVLSLLRAAPLSADEIVGHVSKIVGLPLTDLVQAVGATVEQLAAENHLVKKAKLELSNAARQMVEAARGQEQRLKSAFIEQMRLDLQTSWKDATADEVEVAVIAALSALVSIFDERGVELANATFGGRTVSTRGAARLFATLDRSARALRDELRFRFVTYMANLLTQPGATQRAYIEHLALAFFSLNALAMDPAGHRFQREYLAGRALLVDSNVLIPLMALESTFRNDLRAVVQRARTAGLPLFTISGFIDEVYAHGEWARNHVRKYGEQTAEVLQAARGEGYKRNAFLDGFVLHSVAKRRLRFEEYLSLCVGGREFAPGAIAAQLAEAEGIALFDFNTVTEKSVAAYGDREELEQYIAERARALELDKGQGRIRSEAEAYTILRHWNLVGAGGLPADYGDREAGVLSQGTFFNELATRGPHAIGRRVVVPPDALYGFLLRSGAEPAKGVVFRELLVSPFFDASAHFLDRTKYREFFAHLINDAERIYRENVADFRAKIREQLSPELRDEVREPLDRPLFLDNLENRLRIEVQAGDERAELARTEIRQREVAIIEERRKLQAEAAAIRRREDALRQNEAVRARKRRKRAQLEARRAAKQRKKPR